MIIKSGRNIAVILSVVPLDLPVRGVPVYSFGYHSYRRRTVQYV